MGVFAEKSTNHISICKIAS